MEPKRKRQLIGILILLSVFLTGVAILFIRYDIGIENITDVISSKEADEEIVYTSKSTSGGSVTVLDKFEGQTKVRKYTDLQNIGFASEAGKFTSIQQGVIEFKVWFEGLNEFTVKLSDGNEYAVVISFLRTGDITSVTFPFQTVSYGKFTSNEWITVYVEFDSNEKSFSIDINGKKFNNAYLNPDIDNVNTIVMETSKDRGNYNVYFDITELTDRS
jgi:hypothetical protein